MKFKQIVLLVSLSLFLLPVQAKTNNKDLNKLKSKTEVYLNKVKAQPDWLYSRLQMNWETKATEVYILGEYFDHVGGDKAPVPTVKYNGSRNTATNYKSPKLEDIIPYDDDIQSNVTYINKQSGKMEKVHPSKTGRIITEINKRILGIACDASRIYAETGDKEYADMAFHVFDTFMKGIYYRNMPHDLNNGHQQTLCGLTTFQVIHEQELNSLTVIYKLLYKYIQKDYDIYETAFKKWADVIIANGVPHNNWNLFQAEYIAKIALLLNDDKDYSDLKGRQYYLDYIMNQNSIRQWSMKKLARFGFNKDTHIWYESPGYSNGVVGDFADMANELDQEANIDMFKEIPDILPSIKASAQYLFPNRMICGFGDSHPWYMDTKGVDNVLKYARRNHNKKLEEEFQYFRDAIMPNAKKEVIEKFVSPSFYSPNVSWLVQRTGMDKQHDLMISLNGSLGNHQHANGISMELYGKGWVLGPDGGIGSHLYSGLDYSEYYSQFPAHNTVCVDGVSSYPVMMSNHAFQVKARYPKTNKIGDFVPATFSQVYFLEPETQSDQLRTNGIVKISNKGGYYVDIFRSRKQAGGDKTHDYFYHSMGQYLKLVATDESVLNIKPTQELAFAGGHLYAYSYIYNKKSVKTDKNIKATFIMESNEGRTITMNMWMKGEQNRKIFSALSPVNLEYDRMKNKPYDIAKQAVPTFIARQYGEAWDHPFVAIYEPSDSNEPSQIESVEYFTPNSNSKSVVGIIVRLKSGRIDYIFSAASPSDMSYKGMRVNGIYGVYSDGKKLIEN